MDSIDKAILDIIQSGFPIVSKPYDEIGRIIGVSGDEALSRVNKMREEGLIRRIGANFGSQELGWSSTLCAAKVPEDKLDDFVAEVNKLPGVTHNYLRENDFNVWFTFIGPEWDEVEATLQSISDKTGIKILNLPASRLFKIKVDFDMESEHREKN